jgi:hypothetical protein
LISSYISESSWTADQNSPNFETLVSRTCHLPIKQNDISDWCIVKLTVFWRLGIFSSTVNTCFIFEYAVCDKNSHKTWTEIMECGWCKYINSFSFFSLRVFSCTSQQHGLYIVRWKDDIEYWEGSGPGFCKSIAPLLLGERLRKISHSSWPPSWDLNPSVKHGWYLHYIVHHQQRMVLLSENLTF